MTKLQRNILKSPILLIRIPVLIPLLCLYHLGRWAEVAEDYIDTRLPGLER